MSEPKPRALFLDLDGTLADSLPAMRAAYEAFLGELGCSGSDNEFGELNGPAVPEIVAILRQRHQLGPTLNLLEQRYRELIVERYPAEARLNPGALALLKSAARLRLPVAVVTSAERQVAEQFLAAHQIANFVKTVVTAEGLAHSKPDPAIYLRALESLGVEANQVWVVEDSANGIQAAIAAGLRTFALLASSSADPSGIAGRIASLSELIPWIECDVESLSPSVRVVVSSELAPWSEAVERRVDQLWAVEQGAHPDRFDGTLLALVNRHGEELHGRLVRYRYYLAQRREPRLSQELSLVPLSVSGLLLCGEAVAFARRNDRTTQYPGWLELVPSGGIEQALPDGTIDHRAELVRELTEETGIVPAEVVRIAPFVLIRDRVDLVVDLASIIEVTPRGRALADTSRAGEYESIRWVATRDLRALLNDETDIVPTSRALCEAFLRHQLCPGP